MAFAPIPIADGLKQLSSAGRPGVYFLWHFGAVVYVGQSVNVRERIGQHLQDGVKVFDSVSFLACQPSQLAATERRYIEQMAPKYNQCALAKFMRRVCPERLDTKPTIHGLLRAPDAAAFVDLTLDQFHEARRTTGDLRQIRRPRCNAAGFHTAELRRWAEAHRGTLEVMRSVAAA